MANTATSFLSGLEGRFEFSLYSNPNLPRGSGLGILPNLIPEPQVRNQVRTGFRRFRNQTMASLSVAIYSYPPSQNIGTPSANNPESPCKCCFKVGQECFGWKSWACYNCKMKKIQCSVKIYNRWKCETNASLQSGELVGNKKPPKLASAEDSSHKKGTKQMKTRGAVKDTTKAKGKGKGKAVDAKASKVRKEGE